MSIKRCRECKFCIPDEMFPSEVSFDRCGHELNRNASDGLADSSCKWLRDHETDEYTQHCGYNTDWFEEKPEVVNPSVRQSKSYWFEIIMFLYTSFVFWMGYIAGSS